MNKRKPSARDIGFYVLILVIIIAIVAMILSPSSTTSTYIEDYSEVRRLFDNNEVARFTIEDNVITMKLTHEYGDSGSDLVTHELYSVSIFYSDMADKIDELMTTSEDFSYNYVPTADIPWWVSVLPYALIMIAFIIFWILMMNRSGMGGEKGAMRFGKARTRLGSEEKKKVTFDDVAGADEEKAELAEIVDFLKNPKKYTDLGARSPKGVLLVEMDGFSGNEGVIVMAATNRADILDNALLRPGRFDRQIYVGVPDIKGREAILKVHAKNKMLGEDVDLKSIARGTPGFTGADLENLLNEAALLAARRNKRFITMEEMDEAAIKVIAGPEKKSRVVTEKERKLTAYHEAGHAIAAFHLEGEAPVHQITIIPRGQAGGMTIYRPTEDQSFNSRGQMFARIVTCLGGRMAEALFLDDISTGASNDIQQASSIARSMVTKYGMSAKLGPISFDDSSHSLFIGRDFGQTKSYSEQTAALIDEEVHAIFEQAQARCEQILNDHRDLLITVAEYLLENETMDGETFAYVCSHNGEFPPAKDEAGTSAETPVEAAPAETPAEAPAEAAPQEAPGDGTDETPEA